MEKNDNLQDADGNTPEMDQRKQEAQDALENAMVEEASSRQQAAEGQETNDSDDASTEPVKVGSNKVLERLEDASTTHEDAILEEKKTVEKAADTIVEVDEDEDDNEPEDDSVKEITEKDYDSMEMPALIVELRHLMQEYPINSFRSQAEDIKKAFESADTDAKKEAQDKFKEENPPSDDAPTPQFEYKNSHATEFYDLHSLYRKQKGQFQRDKRKQQEVNLEKRREIIEGIKQLINQEENIGTTFKKFHSLQEEWKATGNIPHDAYNITWEDYRLATQNFYDYIDLSKELRDKDFERNLEFRKKIIARAIELGDEENIHKALRELQELHRMWKEDSGPVAKEERDPIWDEFSAATKVIHDKRQAYYDERDKMSVHHQLVKENIVAEIAKITTKGAKNHKEWQDRLEEINVLRELFTSTGPAPKVVNNELWNQFRARTREFNKVKNDFYKGLKKEQQDNLDAKMKLIAIAEEHQDNENFAEGLQVMKRIQAEWKQIGHVPRKDSDKIWKRFQKACNAFFEKKTAQKNEDSKEEVENFEAKMKVYDALKEMIPQDDKAIMLTEVEKHMVSWATIGRVPYSKRMIQDKFEKLLHAKLKAAGLSAVDAEMLKYQNKLASLKNGDDQDFKNERFYLKKRRNEIQDEMRQLENNLQFINAKDDKNPFLVQQRKNIAELSKELDVIKEKQKQLNILQRQMIKEEEEATAENEASNEEETSESTE
ncbi:DUF349 domain-containing protein [Nonlabens sp. Ci31]|uniref:DUF349 domain-containing protein n=1 Tax=Nonlabens sp. Ci31 TaxID=2608253 RepID=UPI0014643F5B|nr:DUF349 domain-containing protein [Nonlabens sp. Ci31]QJP35339.1 DUF349 domain-containing protein [Nonlabens sp. Ci31]